MLTSFLIMAFAQSAAAGVAEQGAAEPHETFQQTQEVAPAEEIVLPEILVVGRIPRCRPSPGDPLDSVDLAPAAVEPQQQVIKRDVATGAMGVFRDDDPVTGPGVWQRAGVRMDQYVFRVPQDGNPLCIGARSERSPGWGQLRQVVDARPYHGKIVRVTMWAASREAGRVWFWVASGREAREGKLPKVSRRADMAAESGNFEFRGSHRWTPVSLTMGPVRCDQEKLSFGFLLDGPGDLWIYQPEFQVVGELTEREAKRECRAVKGRRPPS
jgi:hypothetical protein